MMKRTKSSAIYGVIASIVLATGSKAAVKNIIVNFEASNFVDLGTIMPVSNGPVTGAFRVAFDSSADFNDNFADISVKSLSIPVDSRTGFFYDKQSSKLYIGGAANQLDGILANTLDYGLVIKNPLSPAGSISDDLFIYGDGKTIYFARTLNITSTAAIPEPAAWALMVAGFGLVGVMSRRKARTVAA